MLRKAKRVRVCFMFAVLFVKANGGAVEVTAAGVVVGGQKDTMAS